MSSSFWGVEVDVGAGCDGAVGVGKGRWSVMAGGAHQPWLFTGSTSKQVYTYKACVCVIIYVKHSFNAALRITLPVSFNQPWSNGHPFFQSLYLKAKQQLSPDI